VYDFGFWEQCLHAVNDDLILWRKRGVAHENSDSSVAGLSEDANTQRSDWACVNGHNPEDTAFVEQMFSLMPVANPLQLNAQPENDPQHRD
jgi:hypothetical protein